MYMNNVLRCVCTTDVQLQGWEQAPDGAEVRCPSCQRLLATLRRGDFTKLPVLHVERRNVLPPPKPLPGASLSAWTEYAMYKDSGHALEQPIGKAVSTNADGTVNVQVGAAAKAPVVHQAGTLSGVAYCGKPDNGVAGDRITCPVCRMLIFAAQNCARLEARDPSTELPPLHAKVKPHELARMQEDMQRVVVFSVPERPGTVRYVVTTWAREHHRTRKPRNTRSCTPFSMAPHMQVDFAYLGCLGKN